MLKKDTKLQQEELIDKYLKDEINILQFMQKHNEKKYIDFEYPLSLNQKIMDKIKKDIKKYIYNRTSKIFWIKRCSNYS